MRDCMETAPAESVVSRGSFQPEIPQEPSVHKPGGIGHDSLVIADAIANLSQQLTVHLERLEAKLDKHMSSHSEGHAPTIYTPNKTKRAQVKLLQKESLMRERDSSLAYRESGGQRDSTETVERASCATDASAKPFDKIIECHPECQPEVEVHKPELPRTNTGMLSWATPDTARTSNRQCCTGRRLNSLETRLTAEEITGERTRSPETTSNIKVSGVYPWGYPWVYSGILTACFFISAWKPPQSYHTKKNS